jgi:hypothetical protein
VKIVSGTFSSLNDQFTFKNQTTAKIGISSLKARRSVSLSAKILSKKLCFWGKKRKGGRPLIRRHFQILKRSKTTLH